MNRTEAIAELERLRDWERGKVIAGISDGERVRWVEQGWLCRDRCERKHRGLP